MVKKKRKFQLDQMIIIGTRRLTASVIRAVIAAIPPELMNQDAKDNIRYSYTTAEYLDDEIATTVDLPMDDGSTYKWCVASPQEFLRRICSTSDAYKRAMKKHQNDHEHRWHMVHYTDDITSGNLLSPNYSRKFASFRFAFREFGQILLSNQYMWAEYGASQGDLATPIPVNAAGLTCAAGGKGRR